MLTPSTIILATLSVCSLVSCASSEQTRTVSLPAGQEGEEPTQAAIAAPQSAWRASEILLEALDEVGLSQGEIALHRLRANYDPARGDGGGAVEAKLDLIFLGEDYVAATERYERLLRRLEALSILKTYPRGHAAPRVYR